MMKYILQVGTYLLVESGTSLKSLKKLNNLETMENIFK